MRVDGNGKVRWTVELNVGQRQDSQAGPLTDGDSVFTSEGDQLRGLAVADGSERWRVDLHGPVYATWLRGSTLIAVVDQVSPNARFTAVDVRTGRTLWDHRPDDDVVNFQVITDDGGLAWVGRAGTVEVVDTADGHVRWRVRAPNSVTPTVGAAANAVLHSGSGMLTAYESMTGATLWSVPFDDQSTFITSGNVVISKRNVIPSPAPLVALDARDGTELWRMDADPSVALSPMPSPAGLFVYDPSYSASKLRLLDLRSGAVRWEQPAIMWDTAGPAVVGSHAATIEATAPADPLSKVTWRSLEDGTVQAASSPGGSLLAVIAGARGSAIVVTDSRVVAVATDVAWEAPIPAFAQRAPVALPDGGAALQLVDPQTVCPLLG